MIPPSNPDTESVRSQEPEAVCVQTREPSFFHFLYYQNRGEAGRSLRFINDEVDGGVLVFTTSKASSGKTYPYTLVFSTWDALTATHFVLQVTKPDAYDLNQTGEEGEESQVKTFPASPAFDDLVPFRIGPYNCQVSPELKRGYLAACQAYTEMEKQRGCAYFLLTGYEYAHLARQYIPKGLSDVSKREWHRGFVAGWSISTFFGLGKGNSHDQTQHQTESA